MAYTADIEGFKEYSVLVRDASTTKAYCYQINKFFTLSKIDLYEVNKKTIIEYCQKNVGTKNLSIMMLNTRQALLAYYGYLVDHLNMKFDIAKLKIPIPRYTQKQQKVLHYEDVLRIIKKMRSRGISFTVYRNTMLLLMYTSTGMRKSEVINLKLSDIELEKGFMTVWKTKTNEPRTICLPPTLCSVMKKYLTMRKRYAKSNYFIITEKGLKISEKTLTAITLEIKRIHGIDVAYHAMRRGFASDSFSAGVEIPYISRALGHKNYDTTLKYYIYFDDNALKEKLKSHPAYKR